MTKTIYVRGYDNARHICDNIEDAGVPKDDINMYVNTDKECYEIVWTIKQ